MVYHILRADILLIAHCYATRKILACVAGGISLASAFFSGLMLWSWPPSSEGFGEESSRDPASRNAWVFLNYAFASAGEFRIGLEL